MSQQNMDTQETIEFHEHLKIRVPAVQEAIKRTRFAFFLCTLASFATLICLWNAYLSSNRFLAEKALPLPGHALPKDCTEGHCGELSEADRERELLIAAFKNYVESSSININLLGIRIGVSDLSVMDSLALYVFLYYALLTIRRENREVGQLLRDISVRLDFVGYAAYSAINSYMVFNLNRTDDNPIASLGETKTPQAKLALIRRVSDILLWAPAAAIALIVLSDALSIMSRNPYPFSSLFRSVAIGPDSLRVQIAEYVSMDIFAVLIGALCVAAIRQIKAYGSATRDVLDEFSQLLQTELFLSKDVSET